MVGDGESLWRVVKGASEGSSRRCSTKAPVSVEAWHNLGASLARFRV
jgi:hypothetical protein